MKVSERKLQIILSGIALHQSSFDSFAGQGANWLKTRTGATMRVFHFTYGATDSLDGRFRALGVASVSLAEAPGDNHVTCLHFVPGEQALTPPERQFAGRNSHPLNDRAFARRT